MRSRRTRIITALLLALSLGTSSAEALQADVHDGDATHEELVRVDGELRHEVLHRTSEASVPNEAASELVAAQGSATENPGQREHGESGHANHTCHLAHPHGGSYLNGTYVTLPNGASQLPPVALNVRAPSSAAADLRHRPPIA